MAGTSFLAYVRPVMVLLMVLTLSGAAYLIYSTMSAVREDGETAVNVTPAALDAPPPDILKTVDSSSLQAIQDRDLFSTAVAEAVQQPVMLDQLPSHLKVVGIVIGATPQVVIEDSSSGQTYFVAQGSPSGGIAIRQADRQRVVLDYQGQNISIPVNQRQQGFNTNVAIP